MPCIRIPLGQPIPKNFTDGKQQTGSKNPLDCGCPICPTKHYCEAEDCTECGEDTEANMPCDLGAFESCTEKTTYGTEVECVQACVVIPPCCPTNPTICAQRMRYFDTKAQAEDFCGNIIFQTPGENIVRFEGKDEFCVVKKAVDGGVVKFASVYCIGDECTDSLTITYDWAGTGQKDLDTATTFLGETVGYSCEENGTYIDWGGDNTGDSATETATIHFRRALTDGAWSGTTTVTLKAGWFVPAGGAGPITIRVSCTGKVGEWTIQANPGQTERDECSSTQVGTITISEDGSFELTG